MQKEEIFLAKFVEDKSRRNLKESWSDYKYCLLGEIINDKMTYNCKKAFVENPTIRG